MLGRDVTTELKVDIDQEVAAQLLHSLIRAFDQYAPEVVHAEQSLVLYDLFHTFGSILQNILIDVDDLEKRLDTTVDFRADAHVIIHQYLIADYTEEYSLQHGVREVIGSLGGTFLGLYEPIQENRLFNRSDSLLDHDDPQSLDLIKGDRVFLVHKGVDRLKEGKSIFQLIVVVVFADKNL